MQTPSPEEISRIVDEVVRRVTAQQAGTGAQRPLASSSSASAPAPPAARPAAECRCGCSGGTGGSGGSGAACGCAEGARSGSSGTPRPVSGGGCTDLASLIDHTLLKASATEAEIEKLCAEARQNRFASVCVNTSYVETCVRLLVGSGVKVCCVVGFPLGAMTSEAKAFETRDAVSRGADEIDMVLNVGKLVSGAYDYVYDDIRAVVRAAVGRPVKVILETALLSEDQKIAACVLAKAAGARFVKTSTGFGPGGATAEDIALMRRIVGGEMGVKASGGIRDCATARQMVASGATRIGASASVSIVRGEAGQGVY